MSTPRKTDQPEPPQVPPEEPAHGPREDVPRGTERRAVSRTDGETGFRPAAWPAGARPPRRPRRATPQPVG
jgi:hypothetical protein